MAKSNKAAQELEAQVIELAERAKVNSWNDFVSELQVPADLMPALASNRPELLALARARAMNAEEVGVLLKLIAGLMETNAALREHAAQVAHLVDNWQNNFTALASIGGKIQRFANFRHDQVTMDEEDV